MPKRFADTKLYDQSWFLDLSFENKMIWLYLERSCDHAGIWEIDIPQMRRKLGCKNLNLVNFLEEINMDYSKTTGEPVMVNRIIAIQDNSKLWITSFISEQYEKGLNGLNTAVPAIKSVVNRLKDEGIFEFALKEGFIRIQNNSVQAGEALSLNIPEAKGSEPFERDKDKDKDKDSGSSCFDLKEKEGAGGKTKIPEYEAEGKIAHPSDTLQELDTSDSLVKMLFLAHWGVNNCTAYEHSFSAKLIEDYGFEEVKTAFGEAKNHNKLTLAYVKGILQKRKAKQEMRKAEDEKKADLIRQANKGLQDKISGSKLNLIQDVYG